VSVRGERDVVHVEAPGSDGNGKEGRQGYSDNDSHDNGIAENDRISVDDGGEAGRKRSEGMMGFEQCLVLSLVTMP
jgi:hypothetical protein